jgi:hypothetical protein
VFIRVNQAGCSSPRRVAARSPRDARPGRAAAPEDLVATRSATPSRAAPIPKAMPFSFTLRLSRVTTSCVATQRSSRTRAQLGPRQREGSPQRLSPRTFASSSWRAALAPRVPRVNWCAYEGGRAAACPGCAARCTRPRCRLPALAPCARSLSGTAGVGLRRRRREALRRLARAARPGARGPRSRRNAGVSSDGITAARRAWAAPGRAARAAWDRPDRRP